jgi:hypothetical protein
MKLDKNTTTLLVLGGAALLFAIALTHSKNRNARKIGRQIEGQLEDDAEDFFFDELL